MFGVGNDIFADFAKGAFARGDLPVDMLVGFDTATACGIGFVDPAGENCIAVYSGANARVSTEQIDERKAAIAAADIVLAQFESPDAPILAAFTIARAAGIRTLLNPSPIRPLDVELLRETSVLVMNEGEARQLAGLDPPPANDDLTAAPPHEPTDHASLARRLLAAGPELVVITLGSRGAVAFAADGSALTQVAFAVAVQDTIGCGDAFTAALAVSLVEDRSLAESLRRAAACGAIVAAELGVFDALPTAAELDAFLARQPTGVGLA